MLDKALICEFYDVELLDARWSFHSARNMSKIRTLGEHLLQVKGVKLQRQNDENLCDDENIDEVLYNELKAWK